MSDLIRNRLISFIHIILITAAYSSPFWLDWKWIALGVAVYWLQITFFKVCVISYAQYGTKEKSFVATGIEKVLAIFNIKIKHNNIRYFLDWALPLIILGLAYALQTDMI